MTEDACRLTKHHRKLFMLGPVLMPHDSCSLSADNSCSLLTFGMPIWTKSTKSVMLLNCIPEEASSNLGRDSAYTGCCFSVFLQSLQSNSRTASRVGHYNFIPKSFLHSRSLRTLHLALYYLYNARVYI
jgi:hypothetical protein